jgi:predicted RNA methylase
MEELVHTIRSSLREHVLVPDVVFDKIFSKRMRFLSSMHWTPVETALRAAKMLETSPEARILDVGSGVGKACIVAALATDSYWSGVEQDPTLVEEANTAARLLGVDGQSHFTCGDISAVDWDRYDGFYFYNPFESLHFNQPHASPFIKYATFQSHLRRAREHLSNVRIGTRVVTYHGLGGDMPNGYDLVTREEGDTGELALWVRTGTRKRTSD